MDLSDIVKYTISGSIAEVLFKDNSQLYLVVNKHEAEERAANIGLKNVLLYQKGKLESLVSIGQYTRPRFWSRGKITQKQLSDYWSMASQRASDIIEERIRKRIAREQWFKEYFILWVIAKFSKAKIDYLKERRLPECDTNPTEYPDRIKSSHYVYSVLYLMSQSLRQRLKKIRRGS